MSPTVSYLIGLIPAGLVLLLLIIHYERQLRISRQERDNLQKQLNAALSKIMAVDYEKLREVEIRANAEAQVAWSKVAVTDGWSLIGEPQEMEIPNAYPTRP